MKRLFVVAGALLSASAHADVFDTFGFGPRSTAMAGAMTAEANDYSAVFYNPALLVTRKDATVGATLQWYRPAMDVASMDSSKTLDCRFCQPPDTVGTSIGIVGPLSGKVKNRVALGVGLHVPTQRLLHVDLPDPNRPYWYDYQSHSERIEVWAALSVRLFDWMTVGVGVQALADLVGSGAETSVDLFSKQVTTRQIDSQLQTRVAPNFGLLIQPIRRLRIGASFRWEMSLLVQIPATVELQGVGTLAFVVQGVTHYSPHTLTGGIAFDVTDDFTLALDVEYAMWSHAPSPYVDIKLGLSGDVIKALGLDSALNLQSPSQPPNFQDTVSGRLGAEYRINKRFAARAGAFYKPTPVPKQDVALTNILAGDTIAGTVGMGFNFDDPLEVFAAPINIDIGGMLAFVLPRTANKDPTDSVPSFTYSGKVYGLNAAVRYEW
jgi:long-chain fatty acid transport protein